MALLKRISECVPEQIVLTELEIDRHQREVRDRMMLPVRPVQRGRGQAAGPVMETVDRVRVAGFAVDDMSLALFLRKLTDDLGFEMGERAFVKDAQFRERTVRGFAATLFVPIAEPAKDKLAANTAAGRL